jgi:repressor LexA
MASPAPELTPRQQQILTMIREWVDRHGYPPTMREIARAVGLASPSSVAHQLAVLEKGGHLKRDARGSRAVALTQDKPVIYQEGDDVRIPVLGAIAAGVPILAVPQGADQFMNAGRILEAGLGLRILPDELDPDVVRTRLSTLLDDPRFAATPSDYRADLESMPPPGDAVDALVRMAG